MEPRAEADDAALPSDIPDIRSEPCQPRHFSIPKRYFGKKNVMYRLF